MKKVKNHSGWIKSLLSFFLLVVPQFFGGIVLLLLGYDLSKINNANINLNTMITLEYSMIISMGIMLWIFMKFIDKQPLIEIGLQTKGRLKEFNYGLIMGLVIMAFAYVSLSLIGEIVFENYTFNLQKIFLSIILFV